MNAKKDTVATANGETWAHSFLGGREADAWNEPLRAPEDWWDASEDVVEEVLIVGGADEVLVDSIRELARRLKAKHAKMTEFVAEGEWHTAPVIELPRSEGKSRDFIVRFCNARL